MSNEKKDSIAAAEPDQSRSEGLLPTDGPDANLDIAEEVSFDLQSDSTRRVGALPEDTPVSKPAEAIAQALDPVSADEPAPAQPGQAQVDEAIGRAVPSSP